MVTQAKTVCSASTPCRQPSVFGQHRMQLHCNVLYWGCYFDGNYGLPSKVNESRRDSFFKERTLGITTPGATHPTRSLSLIHTRQVYRGIWLRPKTRARLGIRNINNVLLNGIIDLDLAIVRLDGDGSWSEYHLILVEKKDQVPKGTCDHKRH